MLTRLTALLSMTVALLVLSVGTASAQAPECGRLGENGVCTVTVTPPGTPPGARPVGPAPSVKPRVITAFDKAKDAYTKLLPPKIPPADLPGRWVVHQHYPTPDNFDPDKGTYVD